MTEKKLLLGDEAIALGAIHAGLSGVYAYPGTPSTEITEFIQGDAIAKERGIHSRWSTNEKTAMEAALGMSFMGKRAMVCMKHVGLSGCADPFVNSDRSEWRRCCACCRRPIYALITGRARLSLLW